jgi:aryl-alcohol dehydrogenase-like predicted oxidoreductase
MEHRLLGRTGMTVSSLCMGTMTFGREADEATCEAMYWRCREAGVDFFDCANLYAFGRSEEILGRLIRNERDKIILTSKVGSQVGDSPNTRGLSRRHIMLSVEASLRRLGTDWLDVYFFHVEDPTVPVEEALHAMDGLVTQGKVRAIGVSNWYAWRIARALGISDARGWAPIQVMQPMYSLVKRTAEIELLPLAQAEGLGVISYSPLGAGVLTGKYVGEGTSPEGRLRANAMYGKRYEQQTYYEVAQRFAEYAAAHGKNPVTLALAWVKAHPAITAPILGARSVEQLEPALAAGDYVMSAQEWQAISDLTPPVPLATDRDEERK